MSEAEHNKEAVELDEHIRECVSGLNDILEAVPNDHVALELLAYIYEHAGDTDKANGYLVKLAEAIVADGDHHMASYVYERMLENGLCQDVSSGGAELCELVQQLISQSGAVDLGEDITAGSATVAGSFSVSDELAFAWALLEAGELTEQEYAAVAHDMAEMATDGHLSTISVLHVLEARAFGGMERVMGFVAGNLNVPVVSLPLFDIPDEAKVLLPFEFMVRRGVLVFDFIAGDALVVVMNPLNNNLRSQIESMLKRKCHYYIALPAEFDDAVQSSKSISE